MKDVFAGDVWRDDDGDNNIVIKVHNGVVAYYLIDEGGDLYAGHTDKRNFIKGSVLIERDGKPYEAPREFKTGSYYPVRDSRGEENVAYYNNQHGFREVGEAEDHTFIYYSWIGEELEIEWPS